MRHEHHVLTTLSGTGAVGCLGLETYGNGLGLLLEDAGDQTFDCVVEPERNLGQSLMVAVAAARVLDRIHGRGVLHKSIAPHHFFTHESDPTRVTLIDFGIATFLSQERHAAAATDPGNTFQYVAPEQTGRMNRAIDRRSDLYSLGATFYKFFTGRAPFHTLDPLELVHCHLTRTPQPPHELAPWLPLLLSRLIMKLLNKVCEERYQSASGLVHDLEMILEQLELRGRVSEAPLGSRDFTGELSLPQRLYGREAEVEAMARALDRVHAGCSEVLLISGHSGIGKSALVRELYRYVASNDYFVAGKFEHLKRSIPYAALVQACKDLVQLTLAEPPDVLAATRQRLVVALGPNGKLLTDFLPELACVIGAQAAVPELGPAETQSRFELVFEQFLGVFASGQRTLVLCLDDLQWADPSSLRLLEVALSGTVCTNLFVIGGYRLGEVDGAHPLAAFRTELTKRGVHVNELTLRPLTPRHVSDLLRDTLATPPAETAKLASVLVEKTGGNPFFLGQLLTSLVHDHALWFEASTYRWCWDLAKVEASLATDNVVQFMLEKLRRLPQHSQEVLRLAACMGHEFDMSTLTQISGRSFSDLARPLWRALEDGLIVPLDGNYRFAELNDDRVHTDLPNAQYRFLHDRVTEAAYSLLDQRECRQAHLDIGRLLLAKQGDDPNAVFQIADHLNRGSELIASDEERRQLAQLNLVAGQRARAGAAAEAAVHYLSRVERLLPAASSMDYDLLFPSRLLQAECEQLLGHGDRSLEILGQAEQQARSALDRARARNLRAVILTNLSRLREAVQTCVQTIELLGDRVPPPDDLSALGAAIGAEFAAYQTARGDRAIASLADLPAMTDPVQLALMETYAKTIPAAFQSVQELMVLVVLKATRLSLRFGSAPITPFMYTQYGLVHSIITGDFDVGYQFGQLGIQMAQRAANPALQVQPLFIFGGFLAHWRKPISESLEQLRLGFRLGLDTGDSGYTCYCAGFIPNYCFYAGESLEEIQASLPGFFAAVERTDDNINRGFLISVRQAIAALRGETDALHSLESADFSEREFEAAAVPSVLAFFGAAKAFVNLVAGRPAIALEVSETTRPLPNIFYNGEYKLIHALALARLAATAPAEQRESLLDRLRTDAATLNQWALSCPANHAHRARLIAAELAAIESRTLDAMGAYDSAIELARENGFVQHQALACECCARFHEQQGNRRVARAYLEEALYAYKRWGALAKAASLFEAHRDLLAGSIPSPGCASSAEGARAANAQGPGGHLDLETVVRATETIAAELSLDRVLERLMRTLSESAGGQRGFLLLDTSDGMRFAASLAGDPVEVRLGLDEALSATRQLATSVVQYVTRTRAPIVVDEATSDPRFRSDPYVVQRRPKSVLCAPLLRRGQVTGILYLENNSTTHGFSTASLELAQFLAAQAAAAVENARLYEELSAATQQLKNTNEHLEQQVVERTKALQSTLSEVWAEMDLARKIQTVLLPPSQHAKQYEIAASMTAAESVGGDYYDIIPTDDRLWVVIGDVSGHGVTAGLIMMMIQTAIRTLISGTSGHGPYSPADVLARTNAAVRSNLERVGKGQYMTVTLLEIDGPRITFAGLHQDILVYRAATGVVERIETHGVWIGVLEQVAGLLDDETLSLEPGDTLLLYSDGITELRLQGQLLGTEELARRFQLIAREGHHPNAIIRALTDSVAGLSSGDDVTILALRYSPDARTRPPVPSSTPNIESQPRDVNMKEVAIEAQIQPIWATVREIRCKLNAELASFPDRVRYATGMVTSELLENAIKYGEAVPAFDRITFSFLIRAGVCRITVTNGSSSLENIRRLKAMIAELNAADDKSALYTRRMQELLERPSEHTGLGIYRIGFEGGFELACDANDGIVTVVATRSVQ
jgi:predicted ATPase/serine phosphatase RsbU (regulator of sigma subunit)